MASEYRCVHGVAWEASCLQCGRYPYWSATDAPPELPDPSAARIAELEDRVKELEGALVKIADGDFGHALEARQIARAALSR